MTQKYREFPASWADDDLTEYFDQAFNNVVATFVRDKTEFPLVNAIDSIFKKAVSALVHPPVIVESALLMRSSVAYRATSLLAMAGMNPEAFVQARSCLEYALYALHINRNSGLDETWLRRHDDEGSLKTTRTAFSFAKVIKTLEDEDPRNAQVARKLYERAIDFGAHPNEMAITANLTLEGDKENRTLIQTFLGGGTIQQRHSLKTTAQVGLCALYTFRRIFCERFDTVGLTERMDVHRSVL